MLIEISSDILIQKKITFENGLNIVLGDANSTNSLGKSTFLLIIDFAMGSRSYVDLSSAVFENIGHHSIGFSFQFNGQKFHYVRFTNNPNEVYKADSDYIIGEKMHIDEYSNWLKEMYGLGDITGSWRSLVGLYSRAWGKKNSDVDKPLRGYVKDSDETSISQLIKLFGFYNRIQETQLKLKDAKETSKALNLAFKKNFIKKISKKEYEANKIIIDNLEEEIADVKENLLKFAVNVEEIYSRELIELKEEKRKLNEEKFLYTNRLKRLQLSLSDKMRVDNKQFERLQMFFDDVNIDKLKEIESFHVKISKILRQQIENSITTVESQITEIENEVSVVDVKIDQLLQGVESPKIIVDRVFDLSTRVTSLKRQNDYYEDKKDTLDEIKGSKESLISVLQEILDTIQKTINGHMNALNSNLYSEGRKTPVIKLFANTYNFDHSGNTGTGKSFMDLILFDLSILELSKLPFLIHDSFLFKNIEDSTVSNIILRYDTIKKQVFIAIDGIQKYTDVAQSIITQNVRLELGEGRLLYGKDFR